MRKTIIFLLFISLFIALITSSCNNYYVIEKEVVSPAGSYLTLIKECNDSSFFIRVGVDTTGDRNIDINVDIVDFEQMSKFSLERGRCAGKDIVFPAGSIFKKDDRWIFSGDIYCRKI